MRGAWGEGPAASRRAQIEPKAALQVPAQRLACKPRLAGTQEQHVHGNDRKLADERQRFERHADAFPESPRPRAKVAHREETAAFRAAADLQGRQLRIVDGKTVEGGQRQPSLARIRSDRQQLLAHQPQELHAREAMSRVSRWRRPVLDQQVLGVDEQFVRAAKVVLQRARGRAEAPRAVARGQVVRPLLDDRSIGCAGGSLAAISTLAILRRLPKARYAAGSTSMRRTPSAA